MKIKHIDIRFATTKATPLLRTPTSEEQIRRSYAKILSSGKRTKAKKITVHAASFGLGTFPPVAAAKILAQEIYRYFLGIPRFERKTSLCILSADRRLARLFQKTIIGYLRHATEDLGCGPFITVDIIIETKGGIVLIKRSNPPFGWALPGGFLNKGESLEEAARREAGEETGLAVKNLKQMHTYSDPSRDPRFHTVTTVFVGQAHGAPRAASDAADARVVTPQEWRRLPLAFDHRQVLEDYLRLKKTSR